MSEAQLSRVFTVLSLGVTAYITYIVASGFDHLYGGFLSWSGGNELQAIVLTTLVCSAVISSAAITYLIFSGKRNLFLILLLAHVWLAIISWVSYLIILIVLGWWFSKYAYKPT